MQMQNRTMTNTGEGYRFGFNGKEIDREHEGAGIVYDYGFRIYNPALGRFLSVDPLFKTYPWYTPYQFAANTPLSAVDIDGLESDKVFNATEQTVPVVSNGSLEKNLEEAYLEAQELYETEGSDYLLIKYDDAKVCFDKATKDIEENKGTMAADNLQLFLNGETDLKIESLEKLSEFSAFTSADKRLNSHIATLAKREASNMSNGETKQVVNSLYAASVEPSLFSPLYYASGNSYIKARAVLTITKDENGEVSWTGTIYKTWVDRYDWHEDWGVRNYFATTITDNEMIQLIGYGAKEYDMRTYYTTEISGSLFAAGLWIFHKASENVQVEKDSNFVD